VPAVVLPLRRQTRRSAGTRRAILRAAETLLGRGGPDALSIRELCARAGVTAPTVYHHFGDKDGLIAEAVGACFAEFDRAIAADGARRDPIEALRRAGARYVAYAVAHPTHYRLLFARRPDRPLPSALASYERLRRLVAAVGDAGRLAVPVEDAAQAVWAAMHGTASLAIAGFLRADAPSVALVIDALIDRLTNIRPSRWKGRNA
jgi:AcrR family transcriptional regulator